MDLYNNFEENDDFENEINSLINECSDFDEMNEIISFDKKVGDDILETNINDKIIKIKLKKLKSTQKKTDFNNINHCTHPSPFISDEDLNNFLNSIFFNHKKKLTKEFKIIIYRFVCEKVQTKFAFKINNLSGSDKRKVEIINNKLKEIGFYIYDLFNSDQKNNFVKEIYQIYSRKKSMKQKI